MAGQGDGQQHDTGTSASVGHASPTTGRRASKRSLDCTYQLDSDADVIDLCDGSLCDPVLNLSTTGTVQGVINLHDSVRPQSTSTRRRKHLSEADSSFTPAGLQSGFADAHTDAAEIDLTGTTPTQPRHVETEQLLAFATKIWEQNGQQNQLRRTQKLYVESKQQNWSKGTFRRQVLGLIGDDLVQHFNATRPNASKHSQASGSYAYSPPSVSPASSSLSSSPWQSPRQSPRGSPRASLRVASLTDVIDVTANYSGAMRTANERIERASSDAALAQLLAEKQELERQLKAALASKQSSHPSRPLRAPTPPHWAPMPEDMHVMYVQLPLPQGCSPAAGDQAMRPQSPPLDQETLQAMMHQGLTQADAEAALRRCNGDGDEALLYAMECMDNGGAAACAARSLADAADGSTDDDARAAAEQALQDSALLEAQQILHRLTENQGSIQLSDVRRIERVQNLHLWTKYCLRRHEIELAAGAHLLNEQMLFHGCRKDTMAVITQEGFDIRVSGMGCALGTGTYFAGNSSYSLSYVDKGAVPQVPAYGPSFGGAFYPSNMNILQHPSGQGIANPVRKRSAKSKALHREEDISKPDFLPDTKTMLLCRVALGRLTIGGPGMRLPPSGFDAVTSGHAVAFPQALHSGIFAVFDNSQAYPEYIVHFTTTSRR